MKIIYAKNSSGIDEEASFRNPEYFERAQEGATSIIIYGDYPDIVEAYADFGVEIVIRELSQSAQPEIKEAIEAENIAEIKEIKPKKAGKAINQG